MPDCGSRCCTHGGDNPFRDQIAEAQLEVGRTHPNIFAADGSLRIDEAGYTLILARTLTRMSGLCARGGDAETSTSRDEIGVKDSNARSLNVDVIRGTDSTPWVGPVWTCRPASF